MDSTRAARAFFGATSLIVTSGLLLQLYLSVTDDPGAGYFESAPGRIVNFFSFFTVLSNVAVAVTTGLLAVRLDRPPSCSRRCGWTGWWRSPSPGWCSTLRCPTCRS